jgi:competence protein ComEC
MRARMLAFCLAVITVCQLPALPDLALGVYALLGAGCLVGCRHRRLVVGALAAFGFGLCWGAGFSAYRLDNLLPEALEEVDFWVTGTVEGLPQRSGRAQQLSFRVTQSCFDLVPTECEPRSRVFSPRRILLNYYGSIQIEPGQRWRWRVRLNRPHGFANPGGFDYEGWLLMQGYAAKGYVRDTPLNQLLGTGFGGVDGLRFQLRSRLETALGEATHKGILIALILGDREEISQEHWALFSATGTNHLIVISGLHVGFIALLAYGLGNALARGSPAVLLRFPAQRIGALTALLAAASYSVLAGFSLPTQRAMIMLAVFMAGRLFARETPHSYSYLLAMSAVLFSNPQSPLGAGFWLSFGAVGTLILAFSARLQLRQLRGLRGIWLRWGEPQLVVFVGMSVPLLIWTSQLSLFSPFANLFAIPFVSLLIVPLALLAAVLLLVLPSLGVVLLLAANRLLEVLTAALQWLTTLAPVWGLWEGGGVSFWSLLWASFASLLTLAPRGWPGRILIPVFLVPLLWPRVEHLPFGQVRLSVLDVGQGLAVVVRTATHSLLYDTGPRFSDNFDAGSGVIQPFLRQQGIRSLDAVVVSHADNDHQGGLQSILALMPVNRLLVSMPQPLPMPAELCSRGQTWQWDGVRFDMLFPVAGRPYEGNNSSCVLRIQAGDAVILLTGDIEREAETTLVDLEGNRLASQIMTAPHHGSQTSSSLGFLNAVAPAIVLVSAGYRSQFGHPSPQVAQRYGALGIAVWNTALSGALQITVGPDRVDPQILQPEEYRRTQARYWYLEAGKASRRLHGLCAEDC